MGLSDRVIDKLLRLPAATTHRYTVTRDLRVPMPDGVELLADRYRPVDDEKPLPVVLVRSPYGRASLTGRAYGAAPARRGFQVVLQSVRGTFGSGGRFEGMRQERADGLATVAWLRAQPWCDGRIAMAGGSYLGYAQWAVAPYVEPPLAALCPGVTSAGVDGQLFPGGSFALHGLLGWVVRLDTQESRRLGGFLPDRARARRLAAAMTRLPLRDADVAAAGQELPVWRDVVTHADPETQGDHWAELESLCAIDTTAAAPLVAAVFTRRVERREPCLEELTPDEMYELIEPQQLTYDNEWPQRWLLAGLGSGEPPPVTQRREHVLRHLAKIRSFRLTWDPHLRRLGARILTHATGQDASELGRKVARYRQVLAEHHPSMTGHVTLMLHTFVGEDVDAVRDRVREPLTRYLRSSFDLRMLAPSKRNRVKDPAAIGEREVALALRRAADRYFDSSGLFGPPDRCVDVVHRFAANGIDEIGCLVDYGPSFDDTMTSLELLAKIRDRV